MSEQHADYVCIAEDNAAARGISEWAEDRTRPCPIKGPHDCDRTTHSDGRDDGN